MNTPEIVYAVLVLLIIVAYADTLRSIAKLKQRLEDHSDRLSKYWREHKDDHYEVARNHERLVEALGYEESRPVPAKYVRTKP